MTQITVAEVEWTEFVRDALAEAIKRANNTASDLRNVAMCDAAGCGFMFDTRDPRHGSFKNEKTGQTYHFCPACEREAQQKQPGRAQLAEPPIGFGEIPD